MAVANQQLSKVVIGSGCFGVVYKASYRSDLCAVKMLLQPVPDKADQLFDFECKLMSLKLIQHANIVSCLPVASSPYPYLVMELMDCSLREYLYASPIRFYLQVNITSNILEGVAYLHAIGIIHGHLSSNNVLIKGNIAKLSDFGMSRLFPDVSPTQWPGTAVYVPPEAFERPVPEYDDIFSVGVLLIQILTGKYPDIARRGDDIAECADTPLCGIAVRCLAECPSATSLCLELMVIQQSDVNYLLDKSVFDQNPQLYIQVLESRILQLQHANKVGEREVMQLQTSLVHQWVNYQQMLARLSG